MVDGLISEGEHNIVVMGDLNEGPTQLGNLPPDLKRKVARAKATRGTTTSPSPGA